MYMCLRQVSDSGNLTDEPYDSAFSALPLSYPQALFMYFCKCSMSVLDDDAIRRWTYNDLMTEADVLTI